MPCTDEASIRSVLRRRAFIQQEYSPQAAGLNSAGALDVVADLNGLFHRQDEDFAVADGPFAAGAGYLEDAIDGFLDEVVVYRDFEGDLAEEIGFVLRAAIGFVLAALAGEAHGVGYRKTRDADAAQCLLNRLEFGGLDDGNY